VSETGLSDDELLAYWHDVRTGVARTQQRVEHVLEDTGVPVQWFPVLHLLHIAEDHRMPMSVLARDVGMTSGGFTKLADRMARDGIIDRRGSDTDRRVVHASLTSEGLALAKRVAHVYVGALRSTVLQVVTAKELRAAAVVMERLAADPALRAVVTEPASTVLTARDPALPERRGRGRERE
jgi:DNA-binding MarR family transcriptional regulator